MTEQNDDLFDEDDDAVEQTVETIHTPRRLLVVLGSVMAGFVFIGVAGAALIFFFVLRVRDHTDPNHTVRSKYSNRYASCVAAGGQADSCSASVLLACEKDSWWDQPSRMGQRETVCLATVPNQPH